MAGLGQGSGFCWSYPWTHWCESLTQHQQCKAMRTVLGAEDFFPWEVCSARVTLCVRVHMSTEWVYTCE